MGGREGKAEGRVEKTTLSRREKKERRDVRQEGLSVVEKGLSETEYEKGIFAPNEAAKKSMRRLELSLFLMTPLVQRIMNDLLGLHRDELGQ